MQTLNSLNDQQIGEALAKSGIPPELIALMTVLGGFGEEPQLCDCPPGICLGDSEAFTGSTSDAFFEALQEGASLDEAINAALDESEDEEFEVVFDPDFELSDEPELSPEDKVEAVAQFGRIVEGLTTIVEIQAKLLRDLVG
jgi:hypothetical protein